MANISKRYPKESTWADFSTRLCRHYGMPYGSKFIVQGANGRRVREDKIFRRKALRRSDHPLDGTVRVSEIVARVGEMLAVTESGRLPKIVALGPHGQIITGNTLLSSWRRMEPAATPEQLEATNVRREEIEFIQVQAARAFSDIEEGMEEPEDKMPIAIIKEMIERYGVAAVRNGVSEARI